MTDKPTTLDAAALFEAPPMPNAAVIASVAPSGPAGLPPVAERPAGAAGPDDEPIPEPAKVDAAGVPFDGERHIDAKHPKTGRWMPRRRSVRATDPGPAGPAETAAPTGSVVGPDAPAEPAGATGVDAVTVTAETAIGIVQTALVLLGEEEGVLSAGEKILLRAPLERVLRKYDVGELPAEIDLAVALAAVVIARLKKPKTMARWERFKLWFRLKQADRRGRANAEALAQHASMPSVADLARR